MPQTARWLKRYRPVPAPRLRLVCLPHGGGTASFFRSWADALPEEVEPAAVQYPGRQERLAESCIEAMDPLADCIAEALHPLVADDTPFALFGHSMGATVAYEVTRRLEAHGNAPHRLFVSGQATPFKERTGPQLHQEDDATLLAGVRAYGGAYETLVDDPDLLEVVLPSLRADVRLMETYRPTTTAPLTTPVTAYVGDADPGVTADDVAAWRETTSGDFTLRTFEGGHFFLTTHRDALLADIMRSVTTGSPSSVGGGG
ncbi:putative thioesterase involved in non-ribosomal peptide biosynthesis [Streptomyces lincolnensis]|uniref:Putative thioesterase involved in non-ribosomal peptide biosynthesis n=1 Tax=Streptomyces lincolnensis TaxID=1915 RepID=A0A1B1MEN3_STRLN|nr:alpha/beta fold hydrolase [Streptomyces lincolnensis]ANS67085.1 putative thioesterase involved in non-ribosomal peptide biosynthesis [Streptomyces lincolnensis]AXG55957.1 putative thioesterase involved in non-ribosomal peptide biosynthesis [Streptomyces lincolnensis]QMV07570.1 alpha/beta fold hydrolase [Streptomyces lincolnensis]